MKTGMYYFMTVAKEESISRAARTLMVSQQSLSEQIKRLEDVYGKLFLRRPRFQLTPVGEALLRAAQQIFVLEQNLDVQIQEIKEKKVGHLRMGIHSLRAMVLLPNVIEKYHTIFPNVKLTFYNDDTVTLEDMLRRGELDVFFGVDARQNNEFEYITLGEEQIYLVASEEFTERHFKQVYDGSNDVLEISALRNIPFIFRHNRSNFQLKVNKVLDSLNIIPNDVVTITDFSIQLMLVGKNIGACFCPRLALHMVYDMNRTREEKNMLRIFSIRGMNETSHLTLVKHKYVFCTEYLDTFIKMLCNEFKMSLA